MIAVVGLGNTLMGDDGIGIAVVSELKRNYVFCPDIEIIDGGVGSFSLPFHRFRKVIIIDAVRDEDKKPGDIVFYTKEEILSGSLVQKLSLHDVSIEEVFFLLALRDELPDEIVLVGVVPLTVKSMNMELSEVVRSKIPDVIKTVGKLLNKWGITVERRDAKFV